MIGITMLDYKKVCIIIPAYNEETTIGDVIKETVKVFSKEEKIRCNIVVVNDSSSDKTSFIAKKAGAKVINHILNVGVGGATATGLSYANQNDYDIAITMDADGQHAPQDALRGVKIIISKKIDLLIGSRLIDSHGMSKVKIIGNKGLSLVTHLLFGINSTDTQSGLRVFSQKALRKLRWKTSGYEFCSEMLWRANQLDLMIDEYPIKAIYTQYSIQKGQNNWNAINIVKNLLKRRIVEIFE